MAQFDSEGHLQFIKELDGRVKKFDYWQGDYLRMSGIYWALTGLILLKPSLETDGHSDLFDKSSPLTRNEILQFIVKCQSPKGGFTGNIGHYPHLTFTLSAIQILLMLNLLNDPQINLELHAKWISERQNEDGSFCGDEFGEIDTRFSYCAVASLALLGKLNLINVEKTVDFVISCANPDGGFGAVPSGESHAGQIFCCVGTLSILSISIPNADQLAHWLSWRQLPCGGLNGRPEKLEDVCYSWWVLSSLHMLNRLSWIDMEGLRSFILECQDPVSGGFSDRPGDMADIFHTLFGLAGLSLLGDTTLGSVDSRFCLPSHLLPPHCKP